MCPPIKTSSMTSFISQSRETATRGPNSTSPAASAARGQSRSANGRKRTTKCPTRALGRGAGPDICNAPVRPGPPPAGRSVTCYGVVVGSVGVVSAVRPCFLTSCGWRVGNPATFMATSSSSLRHDKTQRSPFILGCLPVSQERDGLWPNRFERFGFGTVQIGIWKNWICLVPMTKQVVAATNGYTMIMCAAPACHQVPAPIQQSRQRGRSDRPSRPPHR